MDDLAQEVWRSKDMLNLYTRDSHHGQISVILTAQSYFSPQRTHGKSITAQMTYHVIFSMPTEISTLQNLSRLFTGKSNTLAAILQWIQREFPQPGQNYVFANFHPRSSLKNDSLLKLTTQIFPRKTPIGTTEIMPVCFLIDK
jgi:hypothetical protein